MRLGRLLSRSRFDDDVERIMHGEAPLDHDLAPIAEFVAAMRTQYLDEPAPTPSPALAEVFAGNASHATPPVERAQPFASRRRRRQSLVLRIAIAGALFVMTVGSLGAVGALPAGLQNFVADVAAPFGIHFPHAANRPSPVRDAGLGGTVPIASVDPLVLRDGAGTAATSGGGSVSSSSGAAPTTGPEVLTTVTSSVGSAATGQSVTETAATGEQAVSDASTAAEQTVSVVSTAAEQTVSAVVSTAAEQTVSSVSSATEQTVSTVMNQIDSVVSSTSLPPVTTPDTSGLTVPTTLPRLP